MKVIHLGKQNSLLNPYLAELRDVNVQADRMRFRRNLERIGEIMAYEISRKLPFSKKKITTPLGIASVACLKEQPVVTTILRAGLPLHQGILNFFDHADNAFISAYRKHNKDGTFQIKVEYLSAPNMDKRILILCDPMLATGHSLVMSFKELLSKGKPKSVHIVAVVASVQGINYLKTHLPASCTLWVGAVDSELTVQSYIVPGLGDAGDLAFGTKL